MFPQQESERELVLRARRDRLQPEVTLVGQRAQHVTVGAAVVIEHRDVSDERADLLSLGNLSGRAVSQRVHLNLQQEADTTRSLAALIMAMYECILSCTLWTMMSNFTIKLLVPNGTQCLYGNFDVKYVMNIAAKAGACMLVYVRPR